MGKGKFQSFCCVVKRRINIRKVYSSVLQQPNEIMISSTDNKPQTFNFRMEEVGTALLVDVSKTRCRSHEARFIPGGY